MRFLEFVEYSCDQIGEYPISKRNSGIRKRITFLGGADIRVLFRRTRPLLMMPLSKTDKWHILGYFLEELRKSGVAASMNLLIDIRRFLQRATSSMVSKNQ